MNRGYVRIGILITGAWVLLVVLIVAYQYLTRHTACTWYDNVAINGYCQQFFWTWIRYENGNAYEANAVNLFFFGALPPILGWCLAAAIKWVRGSF